MNGYRLNLTSIKNCIDDGVIQVSDDFGIAFDKTCDLYLIGCLDIIKTFKTAKATYFYQKQPLPELTGQIDICDFLESSKDTSIAKSINSLGFPATCPYETGKICGDPGKKINLSAYKNQLSMVLGKMEVKLKIDHDVGKSCIKLGLSASRERKRSG
ncbi:uncharacterized protein LOC132705285 isoform X2 [Cylas formicarius]|uniref:uncharacterized protein LOC132705285 isoform X2 n=1 Tax=Cylas formicarius TaxID=197179 RepID=UPI002958BE70|nr:uncharacterized protein LOC132705285 isoform X2 [Cylas formicarius]XP_060531762.1 uncharacterized protein LOC132705285 isoform X2 [Cylas formicarius]